MQEDNRRTEILHAGHLQEEKRITKAGGRVLQMSNAAGRRVGPHRVFNKEMTAPGLAMSRSLGDGYAHSLGVSAAPTCTAHRLSPSDQFVVSQCRSHKHAQLSLSCRHCMWPVWTIQPGVMHY